MDKLDAHDEELVLWKFESVLCKLEKPPLALKCFLEASRLSCGKVRSSVHGILFELSIVVFESGQRDRKVYYKTTTNRGKR